jgi:uncharacterized protein (TIGR03437 family)
MFKLYSRGAIALIALVPMAAFADTTVTLSSGTSVSLDQGTTNTSGSGDITWTGTTIAFVGSATGTDLMGAAMVEYSTLTSFMQLEQLGLELGLANTAITPNTGDLIVVLTNGGNYSKIEINSINGTSINITYETYASSGATTGGPQITGVVNNYSYIPTGFPNSGIAPSSIFLVFGSGMATAPTGTLGLNTSSGSGIPKTSAGATFTVTDSGGGTYNPGIYYAAPTQAALVLPAAVKTGTATITVSYKGQTSNSFQFQVVPTAFGLDTYYGTGSGLITAVNSKTAALYNYTNSVNPGDTILLYGSGLGADPADSDTVFTSSPHSISANTHAYFGDVQGTVTYAGSSGYPGLDQINVQVPTGLTSCFVSLVITTGSGSTLTASNFGNIPINQGGGPCTDSILGISGTLLNTLGSKTTVSEGSVFVGQLVQPATAPATGTVTQNYAFAEFQQISGGTLTSSSGSNFSIGSCTVSEVFVVTGTIPKIVGLDAGTISLTGPNGTYPLTELETGRYTAGTLASPGLPANAIPTTGGAFTYNGAGGTAVGSFKATLNFPNPILDWTNQTAGATVTRADGVEVTWTGGTPGSLVIIQGSSSNDSGASGSYTCAANQSALQFLVPAYVTATLPAGTGTMTVENAASLVSFTATGLDFGIGIGFNSTQINTTYQ